MNRIQRGFRAGALLPALLVLPAVAAASVPSEPPPVPGSQPRVREEGEASPLESAVTRAAARLRADRDARPAGTDAVEFALFLYAESGRGADLRLAASLAERTPEDAGAAPLYRVAQAGGSTLAAARARMQAAPGAPQTPGMATAGAATWVLARFARAAALRDTQAVEEAILASAAFLESRVRPEGDRLGVIEADASPAGFEAMLQTLRVLDAAASLSGAPEFRRDAGKVAHELLRRFRDEGSASFGTGPGAPALALQARAARILWETGTLCGDPQLTGQAGRVLEAIRDRALGDPGALAAFGLAAARLSRHPVQMVLLGKAGDPVLTDLRRESYFLFEPRRVLLSLDPQADAGRIQDLGYPAELAPVLFVCVESICSPPIQDPQGLAKKVKDIVDLAAGVRQ